MCDPQRASEAFIRKRKRKVEGGRGACWNLFANPKSFLRAFLLDTYRANEARRKFSIQRTSTFAACPVVRHSWALTHSCDCYCSWFRQWHLAVPALIAAYNWDNAGAKNERGPLPTWPPSNRPTNGLPRPSVGSCLRPAVLPSPELMMRTSLSWKTNAWHK